MRIAIFDLARRLAAVKFVRLATYRLRGRLSQLIEARHEMLEDKNRELRTILAAGQKYIDRLRHLLGENPEQG